MNYVTKYLSKSIEDLQWPRDFRRIRTSIRWPRFPPAPRADEELLEWTYVTTYPSDGLEYLADGLRRKGGVDVIALS